METDRPHKTSGDIREALSSPVDRILFPAVTKLLPFYIIRHDVK